MQRFKKAFIVIAILTISLYTYRFFTHEFFGILDYKPSHFTEQMEKPFFYSIDNTLHYGNSISKKSPILFKTNFWDNNLKAAHVVVSPDNTKVAVVSDNKLYVVYANTQKPAQLILEHTFNYEPKIPMGESFYKYALLQWSPNSNSLYIASDIKKEVWKQSFSHDAVLMRVDLESAPIVPRQIIHDFAALKYFFIDDNTICFNYALPNGDVKWKCHFQGKEQFVNSYTSSAIVLKDGTNLQGDSLASYLPMHMNRHHLEGDIDENFSFEELESSVIALFSKQYSKQPILKIKGGHNIKGHTVYGVRDSDIKIFPDNRYLFLQVWHDNFEGQLLIDGLTGQYKELPKKTKVYLNIPRKLSLKERIEWTK